MANRLPIVVVVVGLIGNIAALTVQGAAAEGTPPNLQDAQRLFYSGRFHEAAALSQGPWTSPDEKLAASELRSSALLFQIRRTFGEPEDKDQALKRCAACPELVAAFLAENTRGQALARARLQINPNDDIALFFLGKLDLNYVWLQLGTFGRKTGWNEYWEARRSLDAVLKRNPSNVRALVARAWIDYIVDTKLPRGTKWLLGGGSRKRGLAALEQAAKTDAEFFAQAEATFALWDMQMRERNLTAAVAAARSLARDFPDNHELTRFLQANDQ